MKYLNPNEYGSLMYDEKEEKAVIDVLKNDKIFRYGENKISKVDEFEKLLKNYVNSKYALGVINGTAGLITALIGAKVKVGDRILVSSYTFLATALAVKNIGAIPVPIDIDLTNGLNLEDLENELKKGASAVIVAQLQGRCFDLTNVKKIVHEHNAVLIEDSCQAFGAKINGQYSGTIGDIGVYSFQQFKQISCGEGGAIVTNNQEIYEIMRNYTDMGSERNLFPNWNGKKVLFGQNYRMNNISGAILCEQIKKIDFIIQKQTKSRNYILKKVSNNKIINSVDVAGDTSMNILLLLNSKTDYELLKQKGDENNIEIRKMWNSVYYENDLFKNNQLTDIDLKGKECKYTVDFISRLAVISIPPILNEKDCDKIVNLINEYC